MVVGRLLQHGIASRLHHLFVRHATGLTAPPQADQRCSPPPSCRAPCRRRRPDRDLDPRVPASSSRSTAATPTTANGLDPASLLTAASPRPRLRPRPRVTSDGRDPTSPPMAPTPPPLLDEADRVVDIPAKPTASPARRSTQLQMATPSSSRLEVLMCSQSWLRHTLKDEGEGRSNNFWLCLEDIEEEMKEESCITTADSD